ncbi:acyl-CoA dehydrogenase family protein [Kitasatospora purpeofusca]|uniref:acyl-CoA dehydrogenase family protein n=1 Tax=Kitasatospora purpeofusca TaxID=67352 RepID=UPI002A5A770C|nr:acyl-CoA dehydrogenase family protein [Kitasatospora purpeofusca]MDY0812172.1 acyl-CoA dehydrogenase family protein [Kitasatospora purpeofusca]
MTHAAYLTAAAMDRRLGDPEDAGRLFSYARCAALDEREEFPLEICRELDLLGLPAHYVPAAYGGTLDSYEQVLQLMRAVARRDLTVAIAHGKTFLGAVSVWVGGSREQAVELAGAVLDGAVVSWGLTEREHGSDLLAGEVRAARTADGYLVNGEKWLINNANRGRLICLLARTADEGGARDFSLLMIDKQRLSPPAHRPLPAVRLHGIRGADISGAAFTDAEVPAAALVGAEGSGTETVLKSLQLTRILCASLSLGAADNALDLAAGFALERESYGRRLVELPQTRRMLGESYADMLLAEAVTLVSGRSIHALTGELAVVSAVTKYFVPTLVDEVITRLGTVLGARSLLADGTHRHGRFQKVQRDHRIVGIFDGNTLVNLHALINQFPLLARQLKRRTVDAAGLAGATDLAAPLPGFDRDRLSLLPRTGSSLLQALADGVEELTALTADGTVPASLVRRAQAVRAAVDGLAVELAAHRPTPVEVPAAAFALAERYAAGYAASAAIHLWLRNRAAAREPGPEAGPRADGLRADGLWADGLWLEAALARVLDRLAPGRPDPQDDVLDRLVPFLTEQLRAGTLPSLLHYPLVKGAA